MRTFPLLWLGILLAGGNSALRAQSHTFTDLGTLGGSDSYASEINERGEIVGTARTTGNLFLRAFVYQNGTMIEIGLTDNSDTYGKGINGFGQIVGVIDNIKGAEEGFLFANNQVFSLGDFGPEAINDSGLIVGKYARPHPEGNGFKQAGRYYNGAPANLGLLPGTYRSEAISVNASGNSVGFCHFPGDALTYAFRFAGQMNNIGTLSGGATRAKAINDRGDVVGTSQIRESNVIGVRVSHGFLYRDGAMTDLGTLGNPLEVFSFAEAINNKGEIVGSAFGGGQMKAVIFRNGSAADLNLMAAGLNGFVLMDAVDINDAGQIIGNALSPNGRTHAFRLDPDSEAPAVSTKAKRRFVTSRPSVRLKGTARDNLVIQEVKFQSGNANPKKTKGTNRWRFTARLKSGRNRILVHAVDGAGNTSKPVKLTITRR